MQSNVTRLIEIIKRLPEKAVEEVLKEAEPQKEKWEQEEKERVPPCPQCEKESVVKNGSGHGKQTYLCGNCKKSFTMTTKTIMENSHNGEAVWKEVIRDTINGVSLDTTAANLDMHHETVFNMRHKILSALEQEQNQTPIQLTGICEADETYILESFKGTKLPDDFYRKPRKHGAKATKPGLSNEYISTARRERNVCCRVQITTCKRRYKTDF